MATKGFSNLQIQYSAVCGDIGLFVGTSYMKGTNQFRERSQQLHKDRLKRDFKHLVY